MILHLFVVPKRDGWYRPIFNLKPLNGFLPNQHFRMESLKSIIHVLNTGDLVVSIDLLDAYLNVQFIHRQQALSIQVNVIRSSDFTKLRRNRSATEKSTDFH